MAWTTASIGMVQQASLKQNWNTQSEISNASHRGYRSFANCAVIYAGWLADHLQRGMVLVEKTGPVRDGKLTCPLRTDTEDPPPSRLMTEYSPRDRDTSANSNKSKPCFKSSQPSTWNRAILPFLNTPTLVRGAFSVAKEELGLMSMLLFTYDSPLRTSHPWRHSRHGGSSSIKTQGAYHPVDGLVKNMSGVMT